MLKKYLLPILAGTIASILVYWGFDGFSSQPAKYFFTAATKCIIPIILVVVVLNLKKNEK